MKKSIFAILLITLVILTACSKQPQIVETKLDISDELNKITENIEDLDFNENLSEISQELKSETKLKEDNELEKISVPATITEDFKDKLIKKQLEESNKTFDIITKAGNTIKLIIPNKDPNGIEITYTFEYPFNKDGIFEDAKRGEYQTKIIATAQNNKIEKEFTILIN